jgi:hypothetical protein
LGWELFFSATIIAQHSMLSADYYEIVLMKVCPLIAQNQTLSKYTGLILKNHFSFKKTCFTMSTFRANGSKCAK